MLQFAYLLAPLPKLHVWPTTAIFYSIREIHLQITYTITLDLFVDLSAEAQCVSLAASFLPL